MFTRHWAILSLGLALAIVPCLSWCNQKLDQSWNTSIQADIQGGRLTEARRELEQAKAHFGQSYTTSLLEAQILYAEQKFKKSLNVLESCLRLRQDDPEVYKLAAFNAVRLERPDIAEQALTTAARLAPNDYVIHFHLGALYYTESRFLEAQPQLTKAVSENANFLPAQLFLGLTLEELGEEKGAIQAYRKAIALNETGGVKAELPYLYLGRLFYRLGRLSEALPALRKAAGLGASSCEAWILLGKTLAGSGQNSDAILAFENAVHVDARNPEAHYLLARGYQALHREQDAKREFALFGNLKDQSKGKNDGRRSNR